MSIVNVLADLAEHTDGVTPKADVANMVVVALGNLVGVLRQAKRLRRLPTDFEVGGVYHEVTEVVNASRFEKGLIAVLALQATIGRAVTEYRLEQRQWCQSVEVTREAVALQFGDNVHLPFYHLTLPLAVDVVAAYLSAGGLGGFALAVLGLDLCHTECKSIDTKKDRHDGRPYINVSNLIMR